MTTQTYCTVADLQDVLGAFAYSVSINDTETGLITSDDTEHATNAIERAATAMNAYLAQKYILSELANSDWCKWVNADWAAMLLMERRNNPSGPLAQKVIEHKQLLADIRDGAARVPDTVSSTARRPSISNYKVDRSRTDTPTPVDLQASTGSKQSPHLKQRIS